MGVQATRGLFIIIRFCGSCNVDCDYPIIAGQGLVDRFHEWLWQFRLFYGNLCPVNLVLQRGLIMVIRFAKQEDLENISVLYVRNHKATYRGLLSDSYLDALTVESAAAKWKQKMEAEDDCLLIAEQDGSFLGFAAAMPDPAPFSGVMC